LAPGHHAPLAHHAPLLAAHHAPLVHAAPHHAAPLVAHGHHAPLEHGHHGALIAAPTAINYATAVSHHGYAAPHHAPLFSSLGHYY
jgi:hypothetical protein